MESVFLITNINVSLKMFVKLTYRKDWHHFKWLICVCTMDESNHLIKLVRKWLGID